MKTAIGIVNALYPVITTIVGTIVDGKANFSTISHVGLMDLNTISVSLRKEHHSNKGITDNRTFSVNIPSVDLAREADFVGAKSGAREDKSAIFEAYYGITRTAPLIKNCPINMECYLTHVLELPLYNVYFGSIVQTYCDEEFLKDGKIDFEKVQPILFSMIDLGYWNLGKRFANTWGPFKSLENR